MTKELKEKYEELKKFINSVKDKDYKESYLIAVLHKTQSLLGYINVDSIKFIASNMGLTVPHIWGVATFYHFFNFTPKGKYSISVCLGTACYVKGADKILDAIKEYLKIEIGQTTEDGLFTLEGTRCVGTCGLAPVIMINDKVYGNLTAVTAVEVLKKYN